MWMEKTGSGTATVRVGASAGSTCLSSRTHFLERASLYGGAGRRASRE